VILAWVQSWNIFEKLMKLWTPPEFFTKSRLTNNYFSRDPHFVILALVQSWNIFEKLMKLWSPPQFFHKNMSHERLLFTLSTFRNSFRHWFVDCINSQWANHAFFFRCIITKCGSCEKWFFVRHVFVKKFLRTLQFHWFFKNISTLYPC